jgi:hypothetical protein
MNTLPMLFQSSVLTHAVSAILLTFGLLMIAGLHVPGAKPEQIAKAIGCYVCKTIGLVLLAISSIQITYALMSASLPAIESFLGLLLLFLVGTGILIYESYAVSVIDEASRSVVKAVFLQSCRVIGSLIALVSGLSILMTFILGRSFTGWEMSATLLLLGLFLSLSAGLHAAGKVKKVAVKRKR